MDQLLKIVSRLEKLESKEFETHIVDRKAVSTKFVLHEGQEVHNWSGPVNIDGQNFRPYRRMNQLNYLVITLTWKLKFPRLPHAHVPTLRRAPRVPRTQPQAATSHEDANHESPYLSRFETNRTYFGRPMRRRDYKRLKAGLWPARKQPWLEMLDAGHVRMKSVHQAERHENMRQKHFVEEMALFYFEDWKRKWDEDGSMLCFEE